MASAYRVENSLQFDLGSFKWLCCTMRGVRHPGVRDGWDIEAVGKRVSYAYVCVCFAAVFATNCSERTKEKGSWMSCREGTGMRTTMGSWTLWMYSRGSRGAIREHRTGGTTGWSGEVGGVRNGDIGVRVVDCRLGGLVGYKRAYRGLVMLCRE